MNHPTSEELRRRVQEQLARLRTERDELKVKLHLAKAEARDEWDKIEDRFNEFQDKAHAAQSAAGEAAKDVGAAAHLLGEELAEAYQRIRKAFSD